MEALLLHAVKSGKNWGECLTGRIAWLVDSLSMSSYIHRKIGMYSGGQLKMLSVAQVREVLRHISCQTNTDM